MPKKKNEHGWEIGKDGGKETYILENCFPLQQEVSPGDFSQQIPTERVSKNKTKQNKTKQNKTKQNKTKQNKTKQNKTKQNKTKQKTNTRRNTILPEKKENTYLPTQTLIVCQIIGRIADFQLHLRHCHQKHQRSFLIVVAKRIKKQK